VRTVSNVCVYNWPLSAGERVWNDTTGGSELYEFLVTE